MTLRIAVLFLAFACLSGCKGDGEPGSFEKFLPNPTITASGINKGLEEKCSASTDGKRFWLEGYLQLPKNIRIENSKTDLEFYDRIDANGRGAGRWIRIGVTSPGDIDDLWASATGTKGIRNRTGQIDPDALRIRTKNGAATPSDKIKLTFDVEGLNLQDEKMATCRYNFVQAEKL